MKRRSCNQLLLMGLCLTIASASPVYAKKAEKSEAPANIEKSTDYEIQAAEGAYEKKDLFAEEIVEGGRIYQLGDVNYTVINEEPVTEKEPVIKSVTSDPIPAEEQYQPPETLEEDGITYQLDSVTQQNTITAVAYHQAVTGTTTYDHPVDAGNVPKEKTVTAKNEATGEEVTVTCKLDRVEPSDSRQVTKTFPVTYYDYGADAYVFNGHEIANDDNRPALNGYEAELLASAGYDASAWSITSIEWSGEPYESSGQICRDAVATISGQQQNYTAYYTGSITGEEQQASYYTAVYTGTKEIIVENQNKYHIRATAEYELQPEAENKVAEILKAISIGLGILVLAGLVILILYILSKHKKESNKESNHG